ncbi:hypothetical protein D3C76_1771060 [compost metagenome]
MPGHDVFGVVEVTYRIAVAVDHFYQLTVIVVAVAHQCFNRTVCHHALHIGQTTKWVVIVQMHTHSTGCSDICKSAIGTVREMQVVT